MTAKEYFDKYYNGWKDIEKEFVLTPASAIRFAENYRKHCNQAENPPISNVSQQMKLLCHCGKQQDQKYYPCCSLEHWHEKFS